MLSEVISFREVVPEDAVMLLNWRTSSHISQNMITNIEYNVDKQVDWILSSYHKPDYYHWIIENHSEPVGFIYITNFFPEMQQTSWGFYLASQSKKTSIIGAVVPIYFYNFLFNILSINTVNIEVFYFNINVIKLHLSHGYKFDPEQDRVIVKNSKEILSIALTLNKTDWKFKSHCRYHADFPTKLRSQPFINME